MKLFSDLVIIVKTYFSVFFPHFSGHYSRPSSADSDAVTPTVELVSDKKDILSDDREDSSDGSQTEPEVERQCGIQNVSSDQVLTPPWALRIIGKSNKSSF